MQQGGRGLGSIRAEGPTHGLPVGGVAVSVQWGVICGSSFPRYSLPPTHPPLQAFAWPLAAFAEYKTGSLLEKDVSDREAICGGSPLIAQS